MKYIIKYILFLLLWIAASCLPVHAAAEDEPANTEQIARQSTYFGRLEKEKAAEIVESCAEATYETNAIITSTKFYMGIPKITSFASPGIRTITKFNWSQAKKIEAEKTAMRITYESRLLGKTFTKTIDLQSGAYTQPDLAAALFALTDKAAPEKNEVQPAAETESPVNDNDGDNETQKAVEEDQAQSLKSRLKKLKELYEEGLISKEVYDSKQNELLESISKTE